MPAFTPEPRVEVAFGFGPFGNPTGTDWVDITDYVDEVVCKRGRSNELGVFQPGTATFTLDNTDRRFDPLNTSSPYTGNLVANVPIRVTAIISATTYPIWRGLVDSWPCDYSSGGYVKRTVVPATDLFKVLAERRCPDTLVEDIKALPGFGIIRRWYRFDRVYEANGVHYLPDALGNGDTDLITFAQFKDNERTSHASTLGALGIDQHVAGNGTLDARFLGATRKIGPSTRSPLQTDQWAVAFTFKVTDPPSLSPHQQFLMGIMRPSGTTYSRWMSVELHATGITAVANTAGTGLSANTALSTIDTINVYDGQPHSVVIDRHGIDLRVFVDGVLVIQDTDGAATGLPTWHEDLGVYVHWSPIADTDGIRFPGVVYQDLIFFDSVNPATFVPASVHNALMVGMEPSVPTTSGSAIGTLLTRVGVPAALQNLEAGEVVVKVPPNPAGTSVLELVQAYADSEDGRLFVDSAGRVTLHAGDRFQRSPLETTTQYTFSDLNSTNVQLDGTVRVVIDDEMVYQGAEVTRVDGYPQYAESVANPNRVYNLDKLRFYNDVQALRQAERIVFRHSTPVPRTDTWDVWPEAYPTDWAAILGLEIGSRVAYVVTPGGVGSQISLSQHLQYIEHRITPTDWVIRMNGVPVDTNTYLTWGGSGAQGWANGVWR